MKILKLPFGFLKTIYLNFKLLPLFDAVKLPIFVTYNTKIRVMGGQAIVKGKISPFMIRIGFHECSECNPSDKTVLRIDGKLIFEGDAHIGRDIQ